jgi:Xaa-Pro aminopeptidase
MAPPFSRREYAARLHRVRTAMQMQEMDVLVIGDPANVNWLTGYDAWPVLYAPDHGYWIRSRSNLDWP